MSNRRIPKELKDQILERIRSEGVTAAQAVREHGVSTQTIYNWLSSGIDIPINILQINKSRRERNKIVHCCYCTTRP